MRWWQRAPYDVVERELERARANIARLQVENAALRQYLHEIKKNVDLALASPISVPEFSEAQIAALKKEWQDKYG